MTRSLAVAGAALTLLVMSACGGGGEPSAEYRRCQAETQNSARAEVVRLAYEQGRLGTQAEIEADFPGGGGQIFDEEGRMIPYEELQGLAKARFDEWVATDDYLAGPVQREAFAAHERVADEGWPDCEDLK